MSEIKTLSQPAVANFVNAKCLNKFCSGTREQIDGTRNDSTNCTEYKHKCTHCSEESWINVVFPKLEWRTLAGRLVNLGNYK